ncbi:hypothetical protein B7C51_24620 (plasmid) [Paenibacillus larvae subsp. pulvifaciens]|uniref:HTH cro/C1-type domain-containing protein n=1 Tax=Paenibacillus larvae subsp. pulvifaciens TaxID=1477 RepID=A0A1V0UZJ3_9BACL|nr:helix-turn-helix transcriptional regulator [Paenibacillus larvae]ARF70662.1 hypothetical protein B7C51_24620 [Paenibacillus larvae subsp. pulvifaciens]
MLSFDPLREWFNKTGRQRTDMYIDCGFAPQTVAKVWGDRFPIRTDVIEKICETYGLRIEQVLVWKNEEDK